MYTLSSRANIVAIFVLFLGLVYPLNDPYCFRSAYDFQCKRICCSELIEQIKYQDLSGIKILNVDIGVADKTVHLKFSDGSKNEFIVRDYDQDIEAVLHACVDSDTPVFTMTPCPRPWFYWLFS
jgi:hypothetical protein